MTVVVLFSTTSFTVDMHYCGDVLVDLAIFKPAQTCGMEMNESVPITGHSLSKKGCCSDKQITVQGQDELNLSFEGLTLHQQQFITAYVYAYINLFEGLDSQIVPFKDYSPPLVVKDIQKLDETYLI